MPHENYETSPSTKLIDHIRNGAESLNFADLVQDQSYNNNSPRFKLLLREVVENKSLKELKFSETVSISILSQILENLANSNVTKLDLSGDLKDDKKLPRKFSQEQIAKIKEFVQTKKDPEITTLDFRKTFTSFQTIKELIECESITKISFNENPPETKSTFRTNGAMDSNQAKELRELIDKNCAKELLNLIADKSPDKLKAGLEELKTNANISQGARDFLNQEDQKYVVKMLKEVQQERLTEQKYGSDKLAIQITPEKSKTITPLSPVSTTSMMSCDSPISPMDFSSPSLKPQTPTELSSLSPKTPNSLSPLNLNMDLDSPSTSPTLSPRSLSPMRSLKLFFSSPQR